MYILDTLELSCRRIIVVLHSFFFFFLKIFLVYFASNVYSLLELTNGRKKQILTQYKEELSLN